MFIAVALLSVPLSAQDRGCEVPTLVSTGGAAPRNPHTLAIRWTGYSNFELAYGGEIMLLDAYFDRGSMFAPLGFKAADVKKANVILIGHGHFDHMSDAAFVANGGDHWWRGITEEVPVVVGQLSVAGEAVRSHWSVPFGSSTARRLSL